MRFFLLFFVMDIRKSLKIISCVGGVVVKLSRRLPASHMATSLCPSCCTSNPALCLCLRKAAEDGPSASAPITHVKKLR